MRTAASNGPGRAMASPYPARSRDHAVPPCAVPRQPEARRDAPGARRFRADLTIATGQAVRRFAQRTVPGGPVTGPAPPAYDGGDGPATGAAATMRRATRGRRRLTTARARRGRPGRRRAGWCRLRRPPPRCSASCARGAPGRQRPPRPRRQPKSRPSGASTARRAPAAHPPATRGRTPPSGREPARARFRGRPAARLVHRSLAACQWTSPRPAGGCATHG